MKAFRKSSSPTIPARTVSGIIGKAKSYPTPNPDNPNSEEFFPGYPFYYYDFYYHAGYCLVYYVRWGAQWVRKNNPRTITKGTMLTKSSPHIKTAVATWKAMDANEKSAWKPKAARRNLPAYQQFISVNVNRLLRGQALTTTP